MFTRGRTSLGPDDRRRVSSRSMVREHGSPWSCTIRCRWAPEPLSLWGWGHVMDLHLHLFIYSLLFKAAHNWAQQVQVQCLLKSPTVTAHNFLISNRESLLWCTTTHLLRCLTLQFCVMCFFSMSAFCMQSCILICKHSTRGRVLVLVWWFVDKGKSGFKNDPHYFPRKIGFFFTRAVFWKKKNIMTKVQLITEHVDPSHNFQLCTRTSKRAVEKQDTLVFGDEASCFCPRLTFQLCAITVL